MTTYNTGNPVGSSDPRDLYDNAQVIDRYATGPAVMVPDRLGVPRKSWALIEQEAQLDITAATEAADQAQDAAEAAQLSAEAAQDAAESIIGGGYQKALSSGDVPRATDGRTLHRYREKAAKIKQGLLPERLCIALVGDSYHEYTEIPSAVFDAVFSEFERGGEGWVGINSFSSSAPPGETVFNRSGWSVFDASTGGGAASPYPLGPDGQCMYSAATTSTCSLVGRFTNATIYYGKVSGAFRYRVDGGSWTTVTQGSGATVDKVQISGLTFSLHTVEIDTSVNTGTAVICGFRMWDATPERSAEVFRMGNAGLKNTDMSSIIPWLSGAASDFVPDLIILHLGTNDARSSASTLAGFKTNVSAYLAAWKALAPNAGVICIAPPPNGSTVDHIPLAQYAQAMYELCIEGGYDFFNMNASFGTYAAGSAFGLYTDILHLNSLGAKVYVRQIFDEFDLLGTTTSAQDVDLSAYVRTEELDPILYKRPEPAVLDHGGSDLITVLGMSDSARDTISEQTGELIERISTSKGLSIDYLRRVLNGGLLINGESSSLLTALMIDLVGDGLGLNGQSHSVRHHRDGVDVVVSALNRLTEGALFRKSDGGLVGQRAPGYYTGQPVYLGIEQGPIGRDATKIPQVIDVGAPYTSRLINLCPGMICLPSGRIYVGYGSDYRVKHEAITNFLTIRISDDDGDTWADLRYIVQDNAVARLIQPHFQYDKNTDTLYVLVFTDQNGGTSDCTGTWVFPIMNPSGDNPRFGTAWRALNTGQPAPPSMIDGRAILLGELRTDRVADLDSYKGGIIYDVDYAKRTVDMVGRLPLSPSTDWPEQSIEQLSDGSLMATLRTGTGQLVSYNASGNPALENWTAWASFASVIGDSTSSRSHLKMSPQGNLLFCYNNSTTRRNMKLALLAKDGKSLLKSVVVDPSILSSDGVNTITTTYPSITFDPYGNILIAMDLGRVTYGQIWMAIVNEQDFVANGAAAVVTHKLVDAAFPLP